MLQLMLLYMLLLLTPVTQAKLQTLKCVARGCHITDKTVYKLA